MIRGGSGLGDLSETTLGESWSYFEAEGQAYGILLPGFHQSQHGVRDVLSAVELIIPSLALAISMWRRKKEIRRADRRAVEVEKLGHALVDAAITGIQWGDLVCRSAARLSNARDVYLFAFDNVGTKVIRYRAGAVAHYRTGIACRIPASWALAVGEDAPVIFADSDALDQRGPVVRYITRDLPHGAAAMIFSIRSRDGVEIGILALVGATSNVFTRRQLSDSRGLVDIAAAGIEYRRNVRDAAQRLRRQSMLTEALDQAVEGIAIYSQDETFLYANKSFLKMHGYSERDLRRLSGRDLHPKRVPREEVESLIHRADAGEIAVADLVRVRSDGSEFEATLLLGPLRDERGEIVGRIVTVLDSTDQTRTIETLRAQALSDPLTGLNNRRSLMEKLSDVLNKRNGSSIVGVIYVDIDRFKMVNDTYGHSVGDDLLKVVAARIQATLRPHDFAGRLGGDEFLIVLSHLESRITGQKIADRIAKTLYSEPISVGGHSLRFAASLGVAFGATDSMSADELISLADRAMYQSKRSAKAVAVSGGNGTTPARGIADQELGEILRLALERPDRAGLGLRYRPIYDLHRSCVTGLEVVSEWNDPVLGRVEWLRIQAAVTSTRQIQGISTWLLRSLARDLRDWSKYSRGRLSELNVGINLMSPLLFERQMLRQASEVLIDLSDYVNKFVIEVGEEAFAREDQAAVLSALSYVHDCGYLLALDGFGRYSSLSAMADAEVDVVKISPKSRWETWGTSKEHLSLCAVVANEVGADIVAKRVDTASDLELVRGPCRFIQGRYLGELLTPDEVMAAVMALDSSVAALRP